MTEDSASAPLTRAARLAREAAESAGERWASRGPARQRRLRRRNRTPLPNLFVEHPAARGAPSRELGLQIIPVAQIVGTAVEGPDQRGSDFRPPPALRTPDWTARWQRIRQAVERLEVLPPIEVISAAGGYWVADGHNRVAAALDAGQLEIDALVHGLRLPGEPAEAPSGSLAAMLAQGDQLRAAGQGLLTPGAPIERLEPPQPPEASMRPAAAEGPAAAGPAEELPERGDAGR